MQRYEPPGDPNNEPTRFASYGGSSGRGYAGPEDYYSGSSGQPPGPPEPPPTPWYLKPAALIGWGALSAILIALLVWGMVQLISNDSGRTKSTTSSTATTTSTTTTTSASPIAPAVTTTDTTSPTTTEPSTTTTTTEPPTTTTEPSTTTTEPPAAATTTPPEGFHLPSEITVPALPTVIQLPPGL
ncbi:MAG TPA: hypothetical protein VFQ37_10350 [Mycobacterium sp.]|nr:hypothetical protein [Mycobacterium sp.]